MAQASIPKSAAGIPVTRTGRAISFDAASLSAEIERCNVCNALFTRNRFKDADTFNQNRGSWDVSKLSTISLMFHYVGSVADKPSG